MRERHRKHLLMIGVTAALAATPIIGDEVLAATIMGGLHMNGDTTSEQRDKRRTGEQGPNGATPKYVGALVIGMIAVLALQVIGLKGFVQH